MKKLLIVILLIMLVLSITSCGNRKVSLPFGDELSYSYAQVFSPGGEMLHEGKLKSKGGWKDHEDATVDLWFTDGYHYLAHASNVNMFTEHEE
jgi:hypothetical protein